MKDRVVILGGALTPAQERQRVRLEEYCARDQISWLRKMGRNEQADFQEREGHRPGISPLWLRDHLRKEQRKRVRTYKRSHPEQVRKSKRSTNANWREKHREEFDQLRLSRPFVVIDSEGQDYKGAHKDYAGVRYHGHGTYLWAASTDDPEKPTHILIDPASSRKDKRKLGAKQILDFLLSLPSKYDPVKINRGKQNGAIFIMFGSGYDITEILCQTARKTAHNILKRVSYDDPEIELNAPELWGEYAFSYMPGKWIDIWRLRDHNKPYGDNGKLDTVEHIKIYDAFGYFQKPFESVVDDMVERKMASDYEQALISEMKARRGDFADETIEKITEYCLTECCLLSKQMGQMRKLMFDLDLRPQSWHGPGAVANVVFQKEKAAKHFGEHIAATNISEQQNWAHHAFIGGRIESLKQGYLKSAPLYVYDVSSCYPAGTCELPSLAPDRGRWLKLGPADLQFDSLAELLARAENASPVSMFKVRWNFPTIEKRLRAPAAIQDIGERQRWEGSRSTFLPFFPLPYRTKSAAILFPSSGRSICMRDDLVAAIKWMVKFTPNFPRKKTLNGSEIAFEIESAWIWETNENTVYPFAFIRDMYNQRRAIKDEAKRSKIYDPMEMVIKLVINSIYGKLAQFVGEQGKVPKTANPYYAAAITAYGRRRLCEAALVDPYAIIFFATDGIVSLRPLHSFEGGLERVKIESKDVISLGDWEFVQGHGGLFVGSGIYIYWKHKLDDNGNPKLDENGNIILKPVAKLRGARANRYKLTKNGEPWLVANVLPIWLTMNKLPAPGDGSGLVTRDYKTFVPIGSALSPGRWPLAGRWSPKPGEPMAFKRSINVHEMGAKRMLNIYKPDELVNAERPAKRTYELIPTIPTPNRDPALSRPRPTEWVDEETGKRINDESLIENAMAGARF